MEPSINFTYELPWHRDDYNARLLKRYTYLCCLASRLGSATCGQSGYRIRIEDLVSAECCASWCGLREGGASYPH